MSDTPACARAAQCSPAPRALPAAAVHYLRFDTHDGTDGVVTLEAMASTRADRHEAVLAEVRQVLDWAALTFPRGHGAVEDGGDWDEDLQLQQEPGGWHSVTLTLSVSPAFAEAFAQAFGGDADDGA